MKKLLFLIIPLNYFSLLNSMELVSAVESKFYSDLNIQGKIAKNMFLLTLYDDECTFKCPDRDVTCNGVSVCKTFRLNCFDEEKLEKYVLSGISLDLCSHYTRQFLNLIHQRKTSMLKSGFDLTTVYSIPCEQRNMVLTAPSSLLILEKGYTQEEYERLKKMPALKGKGVRLIPQNTVLLLLDRISKLGALCAVGGSAAKLLIFLMFQRDVIPTSVIFTGMGMLFGSPILRSLCSWYSSNPGSWNLKKVTL